MSSSHFSRGCPQRGVSTGSHGSPSSNDALTLLNVGPRVPYVTIAYFRSRVSEESDPIFEEINSYPEGGTYIPDTVPRAKGGAYPVDFI